MENKRDTTAKQRNKNKRKQETGKDNKKLHRKALKKEALHKPRANPYQW